jgi:hypothetical protein
MKTVMLWQAPLELASQCYAAYMECANQKQECQAVKFVHREEVCYISKAYQLFGRF